MAQYLFVIPESFPTVGFKWGSQKSCNNFPMCWSFFSLLGSAVGARDNSCHANIRSFSFETFSDSSSLWFLRDNNHQNPSIYIKGTTTHRFFSGTISKNVQYLYRKKCWILSKTLDSLMAWLGEKGKTEFGWTQANQAMSESMIFERIQHFLRYSLHCLREEYNTLVQI